VEGVKAVAKAGAVARGGTFLGIDLGTTNVKAQVVDESGAVLSSGSHGVGIQYSPDGAAEQDIADIWNATLAAVAQATAQGAGAGVRAIGIASQGGAMQILDSSERPSGRVIGWQDSRARPWDDAMTRRMGAGWFFPHTGFSRSSISTGQILRLREQGALPLGFKVSWVGDLVVRGLCGARAHDPTSLSEAGLFNPGEGREDADLLREIGVTAAQLPVLLPVDRAAGGLLPEVGASLGLKPGIPVGPAVHDQYAAATGCAAVGPGDTMLGAGTAWVILAVTPRLEAPVGGVALVGRHPVPGLFGQMLSMVNGGSCITWVLRTLGLEDLGVTAVDGLLSSVPAGCAGLRFRPLLSEIGGAGLPPGTAGRIQGLRLGHTPAHILRSLVEGLACELGRYLHMMNKGGVEVGRLVLCGKAAASTVTPGIIADTTGLPVDCVAITETSSLGAAILARCLVEPDTGLAALADHMRPPVRRVEPGQGSPAARAILEEYLAT
jgi:xylulokinase